MRRALLLLALVSAPTLAPAQSTAKGATVDEPTSRGRAPTPGERRQLAGAMGERLSRSDAGLPSEKRADGTEIVRLQGRFQSVSIARREGGKVTAGCATTTAEADALVSRAKGDR